METPMETIAAFDLVVNGGALQVPAGITVAGLLGQLGLDRRKVAVERNEEIVVRSTYEATQLQAGDRLEIVHFIGGG
jgi:thiamine biosynthesis protein ThiS